MDASASLQKSIYEWLQTSTSLERRGDGLRQDDSFDTTLSQSMDKPPKISAPINADIITPSPRLESSNHRQQVVSDGRYHNLIPQTDDPPEDQAELGHNPYARRPRRKPKEDKYKLKEGTTARRCHREVGTEEAVKSKKRKRQETSGATLLHRYNADNVASDRLTVSVIYFGYIYGYSGSA